ncbi:Proteasome assembly chaperone 3 [Teratosphaeria destructans]|uniref:Proteasome assembly chaperone 3 n=1 Tax=Teratosphaeria destructans TaxID=418781 RepID=A0A9W7SYU7_9PEZI|nr:Proteasome assembly chaperone 3 [Teratosphaeria destructans]
MAATTDSHTKSYTTYQVPFPAPSKSSTGLVNTHPTTCTLLSFTDKLLLTITQSSRNLSHWVHVPLATSPTDSSHITSGNDENALLPRSDLTATTVLGGTKEGEDLVGQTLATIVGSAILTKRPGEERLLVLALGLEMEGGEGRVSMGRSGFEELVGLVLECL